MRTPFLLKPSGKNYLWGGRRLKDDFGKECECSPLAETWECSTHPEGECIVAGGEYQGESLRSVLENHPDYISENLSSGSCFSDQSGLGCAGYEHFCPNNTDSDKESIKEQSGHNDPDVFPLLIKLIDANQDLSVQVHPDDDYARMYENGARGKTELWYVLDAKKDATIYYGFLKDTGRNEVEAALEAGTIENLLQSVPVKKGDIFFVEPGTIHAIGAGVLIAEVQTNSNLTYRLYDYERLDGNGKKRKLHIKKGLDVLNYQSSLTPRQPLRVLHYKPGCAMEQLFRSSHFVAERMLLNTKRRSSLPSFLTDQHSFQVLLCVDGCGSLICRDIHIEIFKGDCIFIPANSVPYQLHGQMELLRVRC